MSHSDEPIFDAVVRIDRLPASGRSLEVNADEKTCAAIAEAMNILAVESFKASLTITPLRGGLRALGRLDAKVVQASVVTLEPVPQVVSEEIDRVFLPAPRGAQAPTPGSEVFIDLDDEDFPDHIDGPEVDLSALLLETLALGLDPYPRREGESLSELNDFLDPADAGPFAKLAKLKTGGTDNE